MADGIVKLVTDAANTGPKVDVDTLTVGANTVVRQRIAIADPATATAVASVLDATPADDAFGLTVRNLPSDGTKDFLAGTAANIAAVSSVNSQLVSNPGEWSVPHAPAVNTVAIASKAAGGAGVRHVCTGVSINLAAGSTAPTATQLTVHLRDGATTAGTPLMSWIIAIPATAGAFASIQLTGLKVVGSANTAMCLEFTAAGGANTYESVNLVGHSCV